MFWPWSTVKQFVELRKKYLSTSARYHSLDIGKLLPVELLHYIKTMKVSTSPFHVQREMVHEENEYGELHVVPHIDPEPLSCGHFGLIFDYSKITGYPTVIKLQRLENVKRPLDIYSYLMEIFIAVLLQHYELTRYCTPRIYQVVRMKQVEDIGCVMEKLTSNLYDFFMKTYGSTNYQLGLQVLRDTAGRLHLLQKNFQFRHRDFRMRNVMLAGKTISEGCVRIIDLGKSSITFDRRHFSAYSGQLYEEVTEDFDLGFFFTDMLLHFLRDSKCMKQLRMYETLLSHFIQGIRYESLLSKKEYLSLLMEKVHHRKVESKKYSTPKYVYDTITEELHHNT